MKSLLYMYVRTTAKRPHFMELVSSAIGWHVSKSPSKSAEQWWSWNAKFSESYTHTQTYIQTQSQAYHIILIVEGFATKT